MNNQYENLAIDRLYETVWGEGIHFGTYLSGSETIEEAAQTTRTRMMAATDIRKTGLVLEVGSGHGVSARHLVQSFEGRVVATNYAANHDAIARDNTRREKLEHRISHGLADFHSLPFYDNLFDLYWCQESFVHATDKPRVMTEAFRVLAPGGTIVFSDQTTNRHECTAEERERITGRHGAPDLCDADDFAGLLRTAGFRVVSVQDWSAHMTSHFERLVDRIQTRWDSLSASIDAPVLHSNYENWRTAADYARRGRMGWHCFVARKPC
ncbi:MAG: methyltransferase domain-containing protein [Alphaproteobacteria bacterium]